MMVNLRQEFTPLSSVSFCSSAYNDCSEVSWEDMKLARENNTETPTTTTTNGSATTKAQQLLSHLSSASTQEIHQALIKYNQTKEHELRAVTAKLSKLQIEHDALKLLSLTSDLEASDKQDHSASTAATIAATTTTSSTAAPQNTTTTTTTQQRFSLPRLNRSRSQRAIHNSFNSASGSMQLLIDTNGKLMAENYKLETSVNGLRRSLSSYIRLSKQCEVSDKETIHKLERENKELKMRLTNNNNLNTKNDVEIVAANTALQQLGLSVNDIPHDVDNPFAGGGEKPEEDVVALALDSPSSTVDERKKEKKMATTNGDDEMKKKMMTVSVKSLYIPHRTMRRTTSVTACLDLDDESDVTWEEEYGYDEEEDGIVLEARHAQSNEEGGGNDITVDELLYNEMMAISASNNHYHNEEEDDDDGDVRKHSNALLVDFDDDRRSRRRESANRVMQHVSCGDGRRWQSQIVLTS